MPTVHFVKKARKADRSAGIKIGDSYYWWKFKLRRGGMMVKSKTKPRRSQLTRSEFYGTLWDLQDGNHFSSCGSFSDMESLRDDVISQLEQLRDEQEEKRSNMPEAFQESSSGEMLQERYDALDSAISELQGIDIPSDEDWADLDNGEGDEEDKAEHSDKETKMTEVAQELQDALDGISV